MESNLPRVFALLLSLSLLTLGVAHAQRPEGEEYTVQAGDWLSRIAGQVYGDPLAYPAIVVATNAMAAEDSSFAVITDPNLIEVGQKLWIPISRFVGATVPAPVPTATVSGTVTYLQRIALPPNAVVEVKLVDVSRQDVAATVLGEQVITDPGQVPVPFEIAYDPAAIDPRFTYAVQARITADEQLLFISDTVIPVITHGAPTSNVEIVVVPVRS